MYRYLTNLAVSIFSLLLMAGVHAQTMENSINYAGTNYPQEKVHIHFDKEGYLPGETIWFKAYIFEEDLPSERSTNFYAAIYDEQGRLIQQQVCPVFNSSSSGHFDIPDSITSTHIVCRAYTTWMLNFDTILFYSKVIKLVKKELNAAEEPKTASLHFFPEGGDIIEGCINTIAFKANFENGLPFAAEGVIKKQETGEVILPFSSVHDGMGKFDLECKPGERYYAEWQDGKGNTQQTWLPMSKPVGVSLRVSLQKDKLYYNLINKSGSDSLHILMYMYQRVFYKSNLKVLAAEPFTAVVPVGSLPSGTMQLTVFNADWKPVAERVAFINNENYAADAAVIVKQISTQKRERNKLEILVTDTIPANMSLSITDADINAETAQNTIVSDLLLKGDITGYVHNPAYYFANPGDRRLLTELDLVMLTNGWRRYNWDNMLVQKMPPVYYPADDYLGIYGQVGQEALTKLGKNEHVNLIIRTADSTINFYSVLPDKQGYLKKTGLVFFDTARVYFSFNNSRLLNKQMAFSNSNFLPQQARAITDIRSYLLPDGEMEMPYARASIYQYYKNTNPVNAFNAEKTLSTLVVKTGQGRNWRNDPLVKMDEKYASGLFAGGANAFAVDVLHDENAEMSTDIYSYLGYKIPGLYVTSTREPGAPKTFMHRNGAPAIYIDGSYTDNSYLMSVPVSQIAYIKFFETSVSEGIKSGSIDASGFTPVLAIYLKKGDDLIDRRPKEGDLGMVKVAGYSPIKEFYAPDYATAATTSAVDARTTLLWMPYVVTDAKNLRIPVTFYNNDFSTRLRVVLEGINDAGKLIRIEKILQ